MTETVLQSARLDTSLADLHGTLRASLEHALGPLVAEVAHIGLSGLLNPLPMSTIVLGIEKVGKPQAVVAGDFSGASGVLLFRVTAITVVGVGGVIHLRDSLFKTTGME